MPAPDANRLNDLKRRWAQDPGSRLYLQLADEHRKHGQLKEAESVLVKGLEHRPSDLSGLVALGRCRLELGEIDEAIASLEAVIARDPAHMVAGKLLIEAHLQQGDAEKAGERLETYRLFNDRDPELAHFDFRLQQLQVGSSPAREPPLSVESATEAVEVQAVQPEVSEPAEPEPVEPEAVVTEAGELEMEPDPVAPEVEVAAAAIPLATPSNGDEIFHLGPVPAAPSLEILWQEPPPTRRAEPFSGWIARPAADALARGDIFRVEPPPATAEEIQAEPPAPQSLISEPAVMDEEAPTERLEIGALPVVEPPSGEPADEMPTEKVEIRFPAAEPPTAPLEETAPAEEDEAAATVTLAELYLQQGHPEEAARVFEQVLEHDPSNQAALAGLDLARQPPQAAPLTALDLLADRSLSGTLPMGLTAKKLLVLTNYLNHIRNVRERDHVH